MCNVILNPCKGHEEQKRMRNKNTNQSVIRYTPENSPRGVAERSTHGKEAQRGVKGQ